MAIPHYDFARMRLNVELAHLAFKGNMTVLERAFIWSETPQGHAYWADQRDNGLDQTARSTLAFMIAQSIQFEIHGARAAA